MWILFQSNLTGVNGISKGPHLVDSADKDLVSIREYVYLNVEDRDILLLTRRSASLEEALRYVAV